MSEHTWPWENYHDRTAVARIAWPSTVQALPVGAAVSGTVVGRQPCGAFARLADCVEGLLPTAELPAVGLSPPGPQDSEAFDALAGEGAEPVHDLPILLRLPDPEERSASPPLPQATCGKMSARTLGPEASIESKQRAKSNALVVAEIRPQQVPIKLSGQQVGVRALAERGRRDADPA